MTIYRFRFGDIFPSTGKISSARPSIMRGQQYTGDPRQEEIAFRVAWAAVKRVYIKVDSEWLLR